LNRLFVIVKSYFHACISSVWVQLLDRPQQRLDLVIIPVEFFVATRGQDQHGLYFNQHSTRTANSSFPGHRNKLVYSLCSHRQTGYWINVSMLCGL